MVELIGRSALPIRFSPGQALFVLLLVLALALAGLALLVLDGVITRIVGALLRATGHPAPVKSRFRVALDAMDEELGKGQPKPKP